MRGSIPWMAPEVLGRCLEAEMRGTGVPHEIALDSGYSDINVNCSRCVYFFHVEDEGKYSDKYDS